MSPAKVYSRYDLEGLSPEAQAALDEREEQVRKLVARDREREIEAALERAGVPAGCRFSKARLDTYRTPTDVHAKAVSLCREAVESFGDGDGLLLVGEPGGGKTHLLVGMLHEAVSRKMSGLLITAEDFFMGLRSRMTGGETEEAYLNRLATVDVLALDDLHSLAAAKSVGDQSYQYRMLWNLFNKRYFMAKPTLVSTNRDLDEFKDMIDERTRRRLQAKVAHVPVLPDRDRRLDGKREK